MLHGCQMNKILDALASQLLPENRNSGEDREVPPSLVEMVVSSVLMEDMHLNVQLICSALTGMGLIELTLDPINGEPKVKAGEELRDFMEAKRNHEQEQKQESSTEDDSISTEDFAAQVERLLNGED